MAEEQSAAPAPLAVTYAVCFDEVGNAGVQLHVSDPEAVITPAAAEGLGIQLIRAAAQAAAMAQTYRDLTLGAGWTTHAALEFIAKQEHLRG